MNVSDEIDTTIHSEIHDNYLSRHDYIRALKAELENLKAELSYYRSLSRELQSMLFDVFKENY